MRVTHAGPPEKRETSYVCAARLSGGDCAAPPAAWTKLVDDYVVQAFANDAERAERGAADEELLFIEVRNAVREAKESLKAWATNLMLEKTLGRLAYTAGLTAPGGAGGGGRASGSWRTRRG